MSLPVNESDIFFDRSFIQAKLICWRQAAGCFFFYISYLMCIYVGGCLFLSRLEK